MMRLFTISAIGLCAVVFFSFQAKPDQYDVCIYGGTSAGVIATYAAARMGKRVILIEPGRHLGGLSSGGLGYTDIGNKYAITGISRDFYRSLGKHYGKFEQWIFEPHVAEKLFNEYIKSAGAKVLYGYGIKKAVKEDGYIKEIELEGSGSASASAGKMIRAKM